MTEAETREALLKNLPALDKEIDEAIENLSKQENKIRFSSTDDIYEVRYQLVCQKLYVRFLNRLLTQREQIYMELQKSAPIPYSLKV